jgi:hypothetical protein
MSTPVRRAIYGRLAGDTILNGMLGAPAPGYAKSIYHQYAPANANHPFVVFQKQAGNPTQAFEDPSALETDVWLVKGIDKGTSADQVEAIQARLIALLNDAPLSISGHDLKFLRRESDVEFPELEDGVRYMHAGALFRLITD